MPAPDGQYMHNNTFIRNAGTLLLLVSAIVLGVSGIYWVQRIYFKLNAPALTQTGVTMHKINVTSHDDVYDLSGSEASGYSKPMNLFDENADPANGIAPEAKTQPQPQSGTEIYYPPGRGLRIVIDLHNLYDFTGFYLYERGFEKDSIWIYTGDMRNWKLAAAYQCSGNTANWGWKPLLTQNQTGRFVMVRFKSINAVIAEMVIYGDLKKNLPNETIPKQAPLAPPTLREFAGTNSYDYVQPDLLKNFGQLRLYQSIDWYDADTKNAWPNNKTTINYFNVPPPQQLRYYGDSLRKLNIKTWISLRGLPKYLLDKGLNEKDKPVTVPGMNTEDPFSYARHARTLWTLAAIYGKTRVDTNLLQIAEKQKFSGLGLMDRFENGNEEDGYWNSHYWTPMDYFAVSSADYDGHEGRMGKNLGIKNADKNCQLMTSGMIQLDTNRVRTLAFLCQQLRTDKKFIWEGGVQYHYYSNDALNNQKPPTKGISPEEDHFREKLAKVRAFHDRLLPGVPLILGENGYDRNQHSWQRTPLLPGYNADQSQGIMLIRSFIAAFMSGFDGYNQYMMRNATNDENAPGPYATSGMIGGPANNTIYQSWYYWSTVVNSLGNYLPDGIISETGPVWIYRFKNKSAPAQKAFILFCPTTNGNKQSNFIFRPSGFSNELFHEIRLTDNAATGVSKENRFSNGEAKIEVGESPVILVLK